MKLTLDYLEKKASLNVEKTGLVQFQGLNQAQLLGYVQKDAFYSDKSEALMMFGKTAAGKESQIFSTPVAMRFSGQAEYSVQGKSKKGPERDAGKGEAYLS